MSANNYDWAQALSASPGSQLAALQARQYESETTQRMMTKFDEAVMTMTAGITDPTELQAAQMRAPRVLVVSPLPTWPWTSPLAKRECHADAALVLYERGGLLLWSVPLAASYAR